MTDSVERLRSLAMSRSNWAVKWRSANRIDGARQHFMSDTRGLPMIFDTKHQAQAFIAGNYGYIAKRSRKEPHGWKMPIAVRVTITITER